MRAMANQILNYPNISLQADSETTEEFQEELSHATHFWNKPCRHPFPCPHGRQTLSKNNENNLVEKLLVRVYVVSVC